MPRRPCANTGVPIFDMGSDVVGVEEPIAHRAIKRADVEPPRDQRSAGRVVISEMSGDEHDGSSIFTRLFQRFQTVTDDLHIRRPALELRAGVDFDQRAPRIIRHLTAEPFDLRLRQVRQYMGEVAADPFPIPRDGRDHAGHDPPEQRNPPAIGQCQSQPEGTTGDHIGQKVADVLAVNWHSRSLPCCVGDRHRPTVPGSQVAET